MDMVVGTADGAEVDITKAADGLQLRRGQLLVPLLLTHIDPTTTPIGHTVLKALTFVLQTACIFHRYKAAPCPGNSFHINWARRFRGES